MVKPLLIGLYSPLPMSGKSTAAAALEGIGYERLPFAGPLKRMVRSLLLDLGQSEEEVERAMTSEKEEPCILLNSVTPRRMMQTLGTDWGRQMIAADLWVRAWKGRALSTLGDGCSIVVDDLRFWDEAQVVKDFGGVVVRVLRPDGASSSFSGHASEGGLEFWPFDHTIVNDGSIDDLQQQILQLHQVLINQPEQANVDAN